MAAPNSLFSTQFRHQQPRLSLLLQPAHFATNSPPAAAPTAASCYKLLQRRPSSSSSTRAITKKSDAGNAHINFTSIGKKFVDNRKAKNSSREPKLVVAADFLAKDLKRIDSWAVSYLQVSIPISNLQNLQIYSGSKDPQTISMTLLTTKRMKPGKNGARKRLLNPNSDLPQ